ncbi:hypothetical protein MLD52_21060 [Puniceicoccaceae bacterium K14]|nr:hypothetical protein [Puniceicoccaceae bacterium K14]
MDSDDPFFLRIRIAASFLSVSVGALGIFLEGCRSDSRIRNGRRSNSTSELSPRQVTNNAAAASLVLRTPRGID